MNYLKQGLYRDSSISAVGLVYHDGMTMGTTLADVAPQLVPPPPPPDAGPPDAGPPDAGPPDAGPPDAGPPAAGPPDAGPPADPADGGVTPARPAQPGAPVAQSGVGFPGQGCSSAGSAGGLLIAALALLRPRRRQS